MNSVQTKNNTVIQVWNTADSQNIRMCAPAEMDSAFFELSQTPITKTFDIRFTIPEAEQPTWESTNSQTYARVYLSEVDLSKPKAFRLNCMKVAYATMDESVVCFRGLFGKKLFLELWFNTDDMRRARALTDKFVETVRSVFKNPQGLSFKTFPCVDHSSNGVSAFQKSQPVKQNTQNGEGWRTQKSQWAAKQKTPEQLLRTYLSALSNQEQTLLDNAFQKIGKVICDDKGDYRRDMLTLFLQLCVSQPLKMKRRGVSNNPGYDAFSRYVYIFHMFAQSERVPMVWEAVVQMVAQSSDKMLQLASQNCDDDIVDQCFIVAGCLVGLCVPQSRASGVVLGNLDKFLRDAPVPVLSAVAGWLNIAQVAYPCSNAQLLKDRLGECQCLRDKMQLELMISKTLSSDKSSPSDKPEMVEPVATLVGEEIQDEACPLCGATGCLGECDPYTCPFCANSGCDGECNTTKPDPVVQQKPDPVVQHKPDPVVQHKTDPVVQQKSRSSAKHQQRARR